MTEESPGVVEDCAWPGFQNFLSHLPRTIRKITTQFTSYHGDVVLRRLETLRELDWEPVEQFLREFRDLEFIKFGFAFQGRYLEAGAPSLVVLSGRLEEDVRGELVAAQARGILRFSGVSDRYY